MNQRKWELHILKRVNVSNHSTGRMLEDSSGPLLLFRDTCFKEPPCLAADSATAMCKITCFRKACTYEAHLQHTCIYPASLLLSHIYTVIVCAAVITPFDPSDL